MQLPESIITSGIDVGPLKDKIRRYVLELSTQLKGMRKLVKDNQEIKDAERELSMLPDVPTAGSRVLVKTLPDKPEFAPK